MTSEDFFLRVDDPRQEGAPGRRYCVFDAPGSGRARAAVVHVPAFAEEMNKSRRMAALQARALAAAGCAVLRIDPLGCGDSDGDFGEADWDAWCGDILGACAWLRQRTDAPLWLWGQRAGALLAVDAARRLEEPVNFLFWQPVLSGRQYLQQFLRLKTAGELIAADDKASANALGGMEAMRAQLTRGECVEIAGYMLAPGLANGLERAELLPPERTKRVVWLEVSAREPAALMPASQRRVEQWLAAGCQVEAQVLPGPAFWMTTGIAESPALIDAAVNALSGATNSTNATS